MKNKKKANKQEGVAKRLSNLAGYNSSLVMKTVIIDLAITNFQKFVHTYDDNLISKLFQSQRMKWLRFLLKLCADSFILKY